MVRKKLDDRVRHLLEGAVSTHQRSLLLLVGDRGKDQIPHLCQVLARTTTKRPSVLWCYKKELGFSTHRQKRIKKLKRDKQRGLLDADTGDQFELFVTQSDITWCYYKDTHRVLGQTFGVLVLQDFEALTPNIMARTIETVQGGGLVVFLLRTVTSLKQLYTLTMDVHARYRTESSADVVPRFNERFLLSLANCSVALVCDDELNVLPISKRHAKQLTMSRVQKAEAGTVIIRETEEEQELRQLQESLVDTPHVGVLVQLTKTLDQAKAVLVFLEACSDMSSGSNNTTVAMTAGRGRGKSAAIGLCLAGAVSLGYSTLAVTAPEPENLVAVFDFIRRGLQALKYQEHLDYTVAYNNAKGRDETKCVLSIRIHKSHRQVIQYIAPSELDKFATAEIVAIDEAAAIPLPIVRTLMKQPDRITFMSSTITGYEGTGRALSLKLIKELRDSKGGRQAEMLAASAAADAISGPRAKKGEAKVHEQRWKAAAAAVEGSTEKLFGALREIELSTPIRYASADPVESWLNKLLCLDCGSASNLKLSGGAPAPDDCELYHVDRDALFSYHKLSEAFLQKLMGLYTSAHYKNTPNDLQMLSDAPAHHVFVLLSPSAEKDGNSLPDILAVVQVALEGRISRKTVEAQLARGHRSAGDLIPWTISQQFGDSKFAQLSGARIVRIAVHPSVQGMGYGSRAVQLLYRFYNGEMISLANEVDDASDSDEEGSQNDSESSDGEDDETREKGTGIHAESLKPRKELPPLLLPLTEVNAPKLDWIGTSFGLTLELHKFWNRAGMRLLYLRQTKNELTGEYSAIMARALPKRTGFDDAWIHSFTEDVKRRFISLLAGAFREVDIRLAVSVLDNLHDGAKVVKNGMQAKLITADELDFLFTPHDLKRLEQYGRNLCDHHLVTDLMSVVSRLYFSGRLGPDFNLSSVQAALLCGIGLQNRVIDDLTVQLGLPSNQVLAMFNKAVRKISITLNSIMEGREKKALLEGQKVDEVERSSRKMLDVTEHTLEEDVADAADEAMKVLAGHNQQHNLPPEIANDPELMQYVVKGSNEQWKKALKEKDLSASGTIQIQSVREKRKAIDEDAMKREAEKDGTRLPQSEKKPTKKQKGRKGRQSL
jgi:N-acetyltransferase 10